MDIDIGEEWFGIANRLNSFINKRVIIIIIMSLFHEEHTVSIYTVTHKSTVARTVMCRQDGRGRFPVSLDDHSKCRTNSQRKSQLS